MRQAEVPTRKKSPAAIRHAGSDNVQQPQAALTARRACGHLITSRARGRRGLRSSRRAPRRRTRRAARRLRCHYQAGVIAAADIALLRLHSLRRTRFLPEPRIATAGWAASRKIGDLRRPLVAARERLPPVLQGALPALAARSGRAATRPSLASTGMDRVPSPCSAGALTACSGSGGAWLPLLCRPQRCGGHPDLHARAASTFAPMSPIVSSVAAPIQRSTRAGPDPRA